MLIRLDFANMLGFNVRKRLSLTLVERRPLNDWPECSLNIGI